MAKAKKRTRSGKSPRSKSRRAPRKIRKGDRRDQVRKNYLNKRLAQIQKKINVAKRESNRAVSKVRTKYNSLLRALEKERKRMALEFKLLSGKTDLAFSDFRLGLSRAALDIERGVKKAISEFRKAK